MGWLSHPQTPGLLSMLELCAIDDSSRSQRSLSALVDEGSHIC